ncbi:MAG: TetR/AcrR family transcriptional regulator C-terminal domain-containing protein [Rhodothermaceae bacterium]|nr:TetR/AcrR family transcriptional regulator C-terminal domain-containing protein [Rhodothermaceae bacterium]
MSSANKNDRRVKRTRSALCQALIKLSLEKRYDSITVQEILEEANVGRSTFYAHYLNKDQLLLSGMPEKISEYITIEKDTIIPSVKGLFEHMQMAYPFFKALMGTDGAKVGLSRGRELIHEQLLEKLESMENNSFALSVPVQVAAEFLVGALLSLMRWWLDNRMPYTPAEMNEMFQKLAKQGIVVKIP